MDSNRDQPIDVFITVDTELWPLVKGWPRRRLPPSKTDFSNEYAIYIEGETAAGRHGLGYQLRTFGDARLKATFFVESLHTLAAGPAMLAHMVRDIDQAGQEVQMHVHTEWLSDCRDGALALDFGPGIAGYEPEAQMAILREARARLVQAGVGDPVAFRAGSYAADAVTLDLLPRAGILFDSSLNPTYPWHGPGHPASGIPRQPVRIGGVWEFPVSCFEDYPGHQRHAQVCAASYNEVEQVLEQAALQRWRTVVIVLHSSEFLDKRGLSVGSRPRTSSLLVRRFERLCRFLDRSRDKFRTRHFKDLDPGVDFSATGAEPIRVNPIFTILRQAEQLASRWW